MIHPQDLNVCTSPDVTSIILLGIRLKLYKVVTKGKIMGRMSSILKTWQ